MVHWTVLNDEPAQKENGEMEWTGEQGVDTQPSAELLLQQCLERYQDALKHQATAVKEAQFAQVAREYELLLAEPALQECVAKVRERRNQQRRLDVLSNAERMIYALYKNYGRIVQEFLKDYEQALKLYVNAALLDDSDPDLWLSISQTCLKLCEFYLTVQTALRGIQLINVHTDPFEHANFARVLAEGYFFIGNYAEASKWATTALEQNATDPIMTRISDCKSLDFVSPELVKARAKIHEEVSVSIERLVRPVTLETAQESHVVALEQGTLLEFAQKLIQLYHSVETDKDYLKPIEISVNIEEEPVVSVDEAMETGDVPIEAFDDDFVEGEETIGRVTRRREGTAKQSDLLEIQEVNRVLEKLKYSLVKPSTIYDAGTDRFFPGLRKLGQNAALEHSQLVFSCLRKCLFIVGHADIAQAKAEADGTVSKDTELTADRVQTEEEYWHELLFQKNEIKRSLLPSELAVVPQSSAQSIGPWLMDCARHLLNVESCPEWKLLAYPVVHILRILLFKNEFVMPKTLYDVLEIESVGLQTCFSESNIRKLLKIAEFALLVFHDLSEDGIGISDESLLQPQHNVRADCMLLLHHTFSLYDLHFSLKSCNDMKLSQIVFNEVQVRFNWLLAEVNASNDKKRLHYLTICRNHFKGLPESTKISMVDGREITMQRLSEEMYALEAKHQMDSLAKKFQEDHDYEYVIRVLEPIFLHRSTDGSGSSSNNASALDDLISRQPFWQRFEWFDLLLKALIHNGESKKAWRCALRMLDTLASGIFMYDDGRHIFQLDAASIRRNLSSLMSLSGPRKIVEHLNETFRFIGALVELAKEIPVPVTEDMDSYEINAFTKNCCFFLRVASEISFCAADLLSLCPDVNESSGKHEGRTLIWSVLTSSVRSFLLFYYMLVSQQKLNPEILTRNTAPLSEAEGYKVIIMDSVLYLDFIHTFLGENGIVAAGDSVFLKFYLDILEQHMTQKTEAPLKQHIDIVREKLSSCCFSLYNIRLTPWKPHDYADCFHLLPLEFTADASNRIFKLLEGYFFEKIFTMPRELIELLRRLDEVFVDSRKRLIDDNSHISINMANISALLDQRIKTERDICWPLLPSSLETIHVCDESNHCAAFLSLPFLRGLSLAAFAQKQTAQGDPLRRVTPMFEEACSLLLFDLSMNPSRFESWYGLGFCYAAMWSDTVPRLGIQYVYTYLIDLQNKAFRAYRRCIELIDSALQRTPKSEVSTILLLGYRTMAYSELGHLVYRMMGAPMFGGIAKLAEKEKSAKDLIFGSAVQQQENVDTFNVLVTPPDIMARTIAPPVRMKRMADGQLVEVEDGESENFQEEIQALLYPPSYREAKEFLNQEVKQRYYSLAGVSFTQARRSFYQLKKGLQCQGFSKSIREPWIWHHMLAKCSQKLRRDSTIIAKHFQESVKLLQCMDMTDETILFGDINDELSLPAQCETVIPDHVLSVIARESLLAHFDPRISFLSFLARELVLSPEENVDFILQQLDILGDFHQTDIPDPVDPLSSLISVFPEPILRATSRIIIHLERIYRQSDETEYRCVYRIAWLWHQISLVCGQRSNGVEAQRYAQTQAKDTIHRLFSLKARAFFTYWRPATERPGKFSITAHQILHFLLAQTSNPGFLVAALRKLCGTAGESILWLPVVWSYGYVKAVWGLSMGVSGLIQQGTGCKNFWMEWIRGVRKDIWSKIVALLEGYLSAEEVAGEVGGWESVEVLDEPWPTHEENPSHNHEKLIDVDVKSEELDQYTTMSQTLGCRIVRLPVILKYLKLLQEARKLPELMDFVDEMPLDWLQEDTYRLPSFASSNNLTINATTVLHPTSHPPDLLPRTVPQSISTLHHHTVHLYSYLLVVHALCEWTLPRVWTCQQVLMEEGVMRALIRLVQGMERKVPQWRQGKVACQLGLNQEGLAGTGSPLTKTNTKQPPTALSAWLDQWTRPLAQDGPIAGSSVSSPPSSSSLDNFVQEGQILSRSNGVWKALKQQSGSGAGKKEKGGTASVPSVNNSNQPSLTNVNASGSSRRAGRWRSRVSEAAQNESVESDSQQDGGDVVMVEKRPSQPHSVEAPDEGGSSMESMQ